MKGDLVMSKREFGLMDLYLTSNNYLDAEQVDERHYLIHLSNGKEIEVESRPMYDGKPWISQAANCREGNWQAYYSSCKTGCP